MEIRDADGNIELIPYRDIMYLTYDRPYTLLVYMEREKKKKIFLQVSLRSIERSLPAVFFRCSQSSILNLCYLQEYRHPEKQAVMEDGMTVSVSRRKYPELQERLASLPRLSPLCDPCLACTNACLTKDSLCAGKKNDRIAAENDRTVHFPEA
jgi:hypothetical protein